ncbi:LINE-1 retrotransposable element ORF2 protein [Nymphaea thermarum]|nr:LINE-1 retrotransposable element ORF2 protein [Nymphaea thermarum]
MEGAPLDPSDGVEMDCGMEEGGNARVQVAVPSIVTADAKGPFTADAKGPSWASIVEGCKSDEEDNLNEVEIRGVDGSKELFVPKSAHEKLKAPFRFSAIATLSGGRTRNRFDYGFIFSSLRILWAGFCPIKFSSVGKGLFLIRASKEADLQMILAPGRWKVGGRVLVANRWQPGMPLKLESSSRVRIWVRLPDFPPELWKKGIFQRLAEMMGATFVEADTFTKEVTSLGYARVLVEVPLGFIPVNEVRISFEEGAALAQSVEYESKVKYCLRCGATSHFTFACEELKQAPSADPASVDDRKAWMTVKSPKRRSFSRSKMVGQADQANRFSALHNLFEKEEGVNAEEDGNSCKQNSEHTSRKSVEQAKEPFAKGKEYYVGIKEHSRTCNIANAPTKSMMMASDSSLQAHQRMDSMAIDETLNQSSSVMVPNRKSPMEKKRQLKSKATSSFMKRSSNLPQPDKVLSGLMVSRADAELLSPQSMDHSNFSAGEARASSAAEDPGDQGMGGPLLKDEYPTRMDEKVNSPNRADLHANPDIAVLIDTKLNEATLEKLSFKFPRYHSISNIHLHGQWARIWLLWDADKMQVQESKVQVYWISITVKHLSSGRIFSVVGVYLHPDFCIRRFQFDELSAELSSISKPHVCLGDFNAVKDMSQKSGRPPTLWPCILFNNFIRANQLKEIHDSRTKYSWSNNRKGPDNVQSLIDHCFVSHDWWDCRDWLFSLCILPRTSSDHSPILMEAVRNHTFTSGISVFRYFNYWEHFPKCRSLVADSWAQQVGGCPMVRLVSKLQLVRNKLRVWAKQGPNDLDKIIGRLRLQVGEAQKQMEEGDLTASSRELKLRLTLLKLIKMDEERLRQKARVRSGGENEYLVSPIRDEEIQWAVLSAKKDSAAGPDVFNNQFYCSFWSIIEPEVRLAIKEFFRSGRIVKGINKTHIVLLPKEEGADTLDKFRPISICNSILKFLSRIMVLRMRPILSRILDQNQSTFLLGRSIQDSFLFSQEVVHSLARSKTKAACIKIDLSKAYDRVNWKFLENGLKLLGFCSIWIRRIMTVVSSVSSALLINGKEGSWFYTRRGLRQGDPLSPYLFIVTMEVLSHDVLLFIEGKYKCFQGLSECLAEFEATSGQNINPNKTVCLSFIWGDDREARGMHLISWETLCKPKVEGGVGLRHMADVNRANFCFLGVKAITQESMWTDLVKTLIVSRYNFRTLRIVGRINSNGWTIVAVPCFDTSFGMHYVLEVPCNLGGTSFGKLEPLPVQYGQPTWQLKAASMLMREPKSGVSNLLPDVISAIMPKKTLTMFSFNARDWTLSERQAIQTWLVVGLPWGCWRWENGTVYNIHIAVHLNKDNRDVSALVREYSGRFIFGIACWSDESRATDEGSLLLHCLRAIQRTDRLDGAIKIICNNGSFIRRCCKCLWNNTVQQVLGVSMCQEQNKLVFIRADPAPEVFHLLRRVDRTISSKVWHRPPPNWRPYEDIL